MKKSIFFRLTDEEFAEIENYCKQTKRTKSDVLRELIRSLKTKKKPSSEGRGLCPISFGQRNQYPQNFGIFKLFFSYPD